MIVSEVIRLLIERTQQDFVSYYASTPKEQRAEQLVAYALSLNEALIPLEGELKKMLPDTEDDGRFQASYAINTGCMMLDLIEVMKGPSSRSYDEAVTPFFDSVYFKVREALLKSGIDKPTETQIAEHEIMLGERRWFSTLLAA